MYGVDGGHLRIAAGGNIDVTLPTDRSQMQHYTEWLKRQGAVDTPSYLFTPVWQSSRPDRPAEQSSWWIDYANFQRGVGALGGGNVDISAGGDLDNLTVARADQRPRARWTHRRANASSSSCATAAP